MQGSYLGNLSLSLISTWLCGRWGFVFGESESLSRIRKGHQSTGSKVLFFSIRTRNPTKQPLAPGVPSAGFGHLGHETCYEKFQVHKIIIALTFTTPEQTFTTTPEQITTGGLHSRAPGAPVGVSDLLCANTLA